MRHSSLKRPNIPLSALAKYPPAFCVMKAMRDLGIICVCYISDFEHLGLGHELPHRTCEGSNLRIPPPWPFNPAAIDSIEIAVALVWTRAAVNALAYELWRKEAAAINRMCHVTCITDTAGDAKTRTKAD